MNPAEDLVGTACAATTLLLEEFLFPFRAGGLLKIFSLWENTLNLTTCSGCNVPVKLAKKKKKTKKLEVRCALRHQQNQTTTKKAKESVCHKILSVFTYGYAVLCLQDVSQ